MNNDKLTVWDCMLYHKAKVLHPEHNWKGEPFPAKIVNYDVGWNKLTIKTLSPSFDYVVEVSDCKLILRSIEQLTDDEKKYIAKNFLLVDWGVLEGRTNQITLIHIMSWCEFEKIKDLFDYFRKIGVDIDNFIATGKAVKG